MADIGLSSSSVESLRFINHLEAMQGHFLPMTFTYDKDSLYNCGK